MVFVERKSISAFAAGSISPVLLDGFLAVFLAVFWLYFGYILTVFSRYFFPILFLSVPITLASPVGEPVPRS